MALTAPRACGPGESYVLYRMLPPGVCRYFFTADGNPTPLIARDHPISSNVTNLEIRNCFTKELALNCVAVKPLHKAASVCQLSSGTPVQTPSQPGNG